MSSVRKKEDYPAKMWKKMVQYAAHRMSGHNQMQAAALVGRSDRTARDWESLDIWREVQAEATHEFYSDLTIQARSTLLKGVKRNPDLAFRVLERVDEHMTPKSKVDHTLTTPPNLVLVMPGGAPGGDGTESS